MVSESNPFIRAKRRAGRVKRWIKRKVYERNIGKQYQAWLAGAVDVLAGIHDPRRDHLDHRAGLQPSAGVPAGVPAVGDRPAGGQLAARGGGRRLVEARRGRLPRQFRQEHDGDARVIVVAKENGGISSALNAALERATGEYVGMLDHDDILDRRCIEAFSVAIEEDARPDCVYSDEDKVNSRGEHFELYCKPDFSPELLLTQMYLCHFTVFRAEAGQGSGRAPHGDGRRAGLRPRAAAAAAARAGRAPAAAATTTGGRGASRPR